jgi:dihydroorotate dehydrogenase (fumarate)
MDLTTTYLGIPLPHPMIVGAGPMTDDLDMVKALEDAGAPMIVMGSLYEEEIADEQTNAVGPDKYLEHLRLIKRAVGIPVIASLNGVTHGGWISYARLMEEAGADGLELHVYHSASDMTMSAADVERNAVSIVSDVKRSIRIPVAVKLAPLLTAFAHFARQIDAAGADALVLFTRFHHVDIDVHELDVVRTLPLSTSADLPLRLRGAAALAGRVNASLAITGGVHTGLDVVKATMAGAHATQMVSALLRYGPGHLHSVRREIESWMEEHEWSSLGEMRGRMSLERIPDPAAYERANFRVALR